MNKFTNVFLGSILVLVLLNLVLTTSMLQSQSFRSNIENNKIEKLNTSTAHAWGKKVINMYNQQDHQGLYALFSEQAKVKITPQQFQSQLKKLFQLFGEIEKSAFVSAEELGKKGDQLYYKLLFTIRVKEASKRLATLTVSVVRKDNTVSLYGVLINATHSLD
jgi:hypothetical protein